MLAELPVKSGLRSYGGLHMSRLTDMSDLNDIVIPEPNLAIINITVTHHMNVRRC